jgi:HSP20 family molecular chaperone IbpA
MVIPMKKESTKSKNAKSDQKEENFRFYWEEPFDEPFGHREPSVRIEVPGFRKNEITVRAMDSSIIVSASKKDQKIEKGRNFFSHESFASSFTKSMPLPDGISGSDFDISVVDGAVVLKRKKD